MPGSPPGTLPGTTLAKDSVYRFCTSSWRIRFIRSFVSIAMATGEGGGSC